jgi:hypothetical protein
MVNSKQRLVVRYKAAFAWSGVGDDLHLAVETPKGKWVMKVRMSTGDHDIHRYYVAVITPDGKKLRAPGGDFRTQEPAKKEADIWVKDLKKVGDIKLVGWKPDNA